LEHPAQEKTLFLGANGHVRPKSRNRLAVKLGALEISSDVWIVARGKAELRALSEDLIRRRTMAAAGGLSDVIKHDPQNNID
jgi:hypothetical protein